MPIANEDIDDRTDASNNKSLEGNRTLLEDSHDSNSVIDLTNESEDDDLKMTASALIERENDKEADNLKMRTNLQNESTINVTEPTTISSESILHE